MTAADRHQLCPEVAELDGAGARVLAFGLSPAPRRPGAFLQLLGWLKRLFA